MSMILQVIARVLMLALLMCACSLSVAQSTYPNKRIRFIVPYTTGGITTVLAHMVGQKLTESWNQPVIVDNQPGGNATIGTDALAKSQPDGYTILLVASSHVIVPHLTPTPYDPIKDFAAVATLNSSDFVLLMSPSVPVNTLQELIAYAKARPGQLNYASSGTGTSPHLATELFNRMAGVQTHHIPYKGTGQAMIDLVGGQVQLLFISPLPAFGLIKGGKLKAIAMSGDRRIPALPQTPTFFEAGLPGFSAKNWHAILAPAGTPRDVIDKLSSEIRKILAMPDTQKTLASQGQESFISTPEQFSELLKVEYAKWDTVIKAAKIKIEE